MIAGYILKIAFFHWQSLHASEGKNLVGQPIRIPQLVSCLHFSVGKL